MLLAEGPRCAVQAFIDRAMKCPHWGPTPARLVGSAVIAEDDLLLTSGLREVSQAFPSAVSRNGSYNGRDCIDFALLAGLLRKAGHIAASKELEGLVNTAYAHVDGR